jgi:septum formation protein
VLVLASTSKYRRELLERLEVPFSSAAPDFDEAAHRHRFPALEDEAFALALARGKAQSLREQFPDAFILAADQVAVLPGPPRELLEKPGTSARAVDQLMRLSGRVHRLVTGVVLIDARSGKERAAVDRHRITMRPYPREEAEAYVRRWQPLDSAGSYRVEDAGIKLMSRMEGEDFTGIIGLPLLVVSRLLRDVGLLAGDVVSSGSDPLWTDEHETVVERLAQEFELRFARGVPGHELLFDFERRHAFVPSPAELSACVVAFDELVRRVEVGGVMHLLQDAMLGASELLLAYLGRAGDEGVAALPRAELERLARRISQRVEHIAATLEQSGVGGMDAIKRLRAIEESLWRGVAPGAPG